MLPKTLLVDDNFADQILAQTLLETMKHKVTVAGNGFEAIEEIDKESFDLFVVDLQMPHMSGLELLKRLRSMPSVKDVPIIIMSGRNESKDVNLAVSLGAKDYITKPIDLDIFKGKVKTLTGTGDTNFKEYEIDQNNIIQDCRIKAPMNVLTLCEMSGSLVTTIPLKEGEMNCIDLHVGDSLKIDNANIRVSSCEEEDNGQYLVKFSFAGLTEGERTKIREFSTEAWRKNSKRPQD